jgi:GntR family transcriptional regulator/MocR family aminotransferase
VELFLDPDDPRPRKVQLYEQLRTAIVEGRLTPGDRLTPSRIMAAALHISRATVTEAYGRLSAEGYIEGRSGGGSVVSAAPLQVRPRSGVAALEPTRRAASITPYDRDPPPRPCSTSARAASTPHCSRSQPGAAASYEP